MIYVLILVISGHSVHTQEFNSQDTCEAAVKEYVLANNIFAIGGYRAICVKK